MGMNMDVQADHQGTNVVGHFVFTKLCLPLVQAAAKTGSPNATRIVFTSSNGHEFSPKGIIDFNDPNLPGQNNWKKYGQSKAVIPRLTITNERGISYSQHILLTIMPRTVLWPFR
jgi:NAD(P)-dependent dehydrogenase (short-subunit alcohol dehydrogenase family)